MEVKYSDGIYLIYVNGERVGIKIDDLVEVDVVNEWTHSVSAVVEVGDGKMLYGNDIIDGKDVELVGYENKRRRELIAVRTKCQCSQDELRNLVMDILSRYQGRALMDYLQSRRKTTQASA